MSARIFDEEYLAALRWACGLDDRVRSQIYDYMTLPEYEDKFAVKRRAWRDVSYVSNAASLVRDLLARAGWRALDKDTAFMRDTSDAIDVWNEDGCVWWQSPATNDVTFAAVRVRMPDVPRIIFALASLAPGDRDGAARALKENVR